jgi:hypothetical protein
MSWQATGKALAGQWTATAHTGGVTEPASPHISRIGHWMDFRVISASSLSSNRAIQAIR